MLRKPSIVFIQSSIVLLYFSFLIVHFCLLNELGIVYFLVNLLLVTFYSLDTIESFVSCRENFFWSSWQSLLCCTWGPAQALWSWSRCMECWSYLVYLTKWCSTVLGWYINCILLSWSCLYRNIKLFYFSLFNPFYILLALICISCYLQKLKQGYLERF